MLILSVCNSYYWTKTVPYNFKGTYNFIKVPVPEGGIEFPIGLDDEDTARIENAFYIAETLVTRALWDTVARWATEKKLAPYRDVFSYNHHEDDNGLKRTDNKVGVYGDLPIGIDTDLIYSNYKLGKNDWGLKVIPQWCNAFTEWYNEKYGTNYIPVYQDMYGNPINSPVGSQEINLLDSINTNVNGFRLPSTIEWELAARWNGSSSVNTVTATINSIDFSAQPIKFTTGRSASGAKNDVTNLGENNRVAIWENNSNTFYKKVLPSSITSYPAPIKSKESNMLGIYDMSGNAMEHTGTYTPRSVNSGGYQSKGGSYFSNYEDIAIGKLFEHDSSMNHFCFRLARNAE